MFIVYFTLFELSTLFLLCDSEPCTYDVIYIYIYDEVVITVISPISIYVVSFLSLYTYFFYIVCNLIFLFHTKMP